MAKKGIKVNAREWDSWDEMFEKPVAPAGPGMGALRQAESAIAEPPSIAAAFPESMGSFRQKEGTTPLPIAGMDYDVPPPPIDTSVIGMEEISYAPTRAQRIANMSDAGKSFDKGVAGVVGGMGGAIRMIGMEDTGRTIADQMDRVIEEIPQTKGELNLQKNPFTLDPANIGHIFTPEFWNDGRLVASFANAAGSSAPFLVGSMIAAATAPVSGTALGTAAIARIGQAALSTPVGRATIGKIVTNPLAQKAFQNTIGKLGDFGKAFVVARVASSIPESFTEGGGSYNEMAKWNEAVSVMRDPNALPQDKSSAKELLKKMYEQNGGKGELDTDHAPTIDDAKWRAWKQTMLNMPLLAASNAVEAVNILSPAKNIITGTARKMAFGAAQGSGEEFGQEGAGYGVPGVGTHGTPLQGEEFVWSLDPRKWNANTRNAVAGGGMFGGVMGAAGGGAGPSNQNIPAKTNITAEQPKLKIGDVLPDDEFGPVTFSGLSPDGQAVFSTENGTQITMPVPVEYIDPSALGKTTKSPGTAPLPTENNPSPANPANKAPEAANSLVSGDSGNVFSNGWKLGEGIRNGTDTGPLAEVQNTLNSLRQQPMEMDQARIVAEEMLSGLSDVELIALLDRETFGNVVKGEPAMPRDERTVPNLPAIEWNRRYPIGHAATASATSDKPKSKAEALKLATDDLAAAKRRYGANPTDAQRRSLERKQKEVDEIKGLDDWGQTNTITPGPAVWNSKDGDVSVNITGLAGEKDGVQYVNVEGSSTAIPLNEISTLNVKAEKHEVDAAPILAPNKNWKIDPGAMPGEPEMFFGVKDGDFETATAAIRQVVDDQGKALWESMLDDGTVVGQFSSSAEAASAAEKAMQSTPTNIPAKEHLKNGISVGDNRGRNIKNDAAEKMFASSVALAQTPVTIKEIGVSSEDKRSTKTVKLASSDNSVEVFIDEARLSWAVAATGADSYKAADRSKPLVLYKKDTPVGLIAPVNFPSGTTLNFGIDPFQLIPGLRKYSDMTAKEAFNDLVAIGRKVFEETSHGGKWMARMKELLGDVWTKAKPVMMKVWNEIKRTLKENTGAIRLGGQRIEASAVVVPADTKTGGKETVNQLVEDGWMAKTAQDGSKVLIRPQAKPKEVPESFTPVIPGMDRNVAFEFDQSSEVPEIPTGEKLRDSMKKFWAYASRKYSTLPRNAEFAPLEFSLTQLEHKKGVATDTTVKTIQGIVSTLKNKKDYQIFSHKVVFDDIAADLEADPEYKMPFGLTQENFQEQYDAVNAAVTPEIQQAIDARKEAWNDFKEKYVASMKAIGFNVEDRLKKGDTYFHHIVLDYAELKKRLDPVLGTQIRTPSYRGFLKSREGSTKNILTDYLQPEMEVMGQMMYDVEIAKVIKMVSDKYDIQSDLKKIATASNEFNTIKSLIDEKGEIDGMKSWTQLSKKQAMAMSRLAELAFNDELPNNGKFDDVLDALTEAHSSGEQLELPKNRLFAYLTYLMNADSDAGKMAAGLMFKGIREKAAAIKERLGDEHLSWRDLIPEGYEPWQPREGNIFYTGYTIPEHIAQGIAEKAVSELGVPADKVRRVMLQGGKRREMVVPVEVASTLEEIVPAHAYRSWVLNGLTHLQGKWKQAVLQMPNRFLSYNFNNMVGDLDAVVAAQGHKAMRKTMTAARELYGVFYKGKEMSPLMKEWFNRGGFETLLQTQEAGKVNQLATFDRLMEREKKLSQLPMKVWQSYWHGARKATDFREAIMRYAKFLDYVEQMNGTGVPNEFGASDPDSVMALDNEYDRAFKLSNELLGAYDSISEMGRDMRSFIWPFWSWKEVNATRYAQMIRNATVDSSTASETAIAVAGQALRRAPFAAIKAGAFMVKATFLWALIQTYNWWMWPEEEKDLEDGVKYKMHIILGRDQDGKVRYIKASGAFADLLGWVSLDTPMQHYDAWLSGRKSIKEIAADMAWAPTNVTLSGITPYFKVAAEMIYGKSVFPDWRRPRPIRDKGLYLAGTIALGNEYRAAFGLPSRQYTPIDWSMVKKSDPLQAAYYSFMSTKQRFMEEKGKGEGFFNSPKSEALRNYKEALRYQDEQAAVKYLEQYKLAGGTREGMERSMESMNPTAGLKVSERKEFLASLNPEERRKMDMAQQYFDMVIARSGGALSVTKKGVIDVKLKGVDLPSEKKPKKQNFF